LTSRTERLSARLERRPWVLALFAVPILPLTFLGYGTDIDTANVRRSAAAIAHGNYALSRPPGSLVLEAATSVLDRIGGAVAVNLATLALAVAFVLLLPRVLRQAGAHHAELATLAVIACPHFLIAATSLADHVWSLAFLVGGVNAKQRDHPVIAGVLWAMAISARIAAGLLVLAYLLGELLATRTGRRATAVSAVIAAALGAAAFIPSWLAVGRTADFLRDTLPTPTPWNLLGRWAIKQELFFGVPGLIVLGAGLGAFLAGIRRWRTSPLLALAVGGCITIEAVFFRLPYKFAHLLPLLVCVVIVMALSPRTRPGWFVAFALTQIVWGFVAIRIVVPDVPEQAKGVNVDVAVVRGPLLTDVECRLDERRLPAPTPPERFARAVAEFECANRWAYGYGTVGFPVAPPGP
jgi:hypothetical protein